MDCKKRSCINYDSLKYYHSRAIHPDEPLFQLTDPEIPLDCRFCSRFYPDRFEKHSISDEIVGR
jgi:hypothetical protein